MPNWVYNTLTIQDADANVIKRIRKQLNRPFTRPSETWNMETQQMEAIEYKYSKPIFAFWNIIVPTDMDTYALQKDPNEDPTKLFSGNNWYSWNVRNWGTKWDVAVSDDEKWPDTEELEYMSEGEDHWVVYKFNTAWSPAEPAIKELSRQYPTCVFTLDYEEETGWGGESEFVNGEQTQDNFYDWKCRECNHTEDETPYCETCEFDMCPSCGYGEPMDADRAKCPTHMLESDTKERELTK